MKLIIPLSAALLAFVAVCGYALRSIVKKRRLRRMREEAERARLEEERARLEGERLKRDVTIAHESGHAVLAWLSAHVSSLEEVSVSRRHTLYTWSGSSFESCWDQITIGLGGIAGEISAFGKTRSGRARTDLRQVLDAARNLVREWNEATVRAKLASVAYGDRGLDITKMFRVAIAPLEGEVMNACYRRARKLLEENSGPFERIRAALAEHDTLEKDELVPYFGPRLWARGYKSGRQ